MTIKGDDSTKPVVLFIHGGPGSTMSPYGDEVYGYWKKDFILVNWDQRGAGRTFGRNAPANVTEDYWVKNPLTLEQMTGDGIGVVEYLLKHLGKKKIILIGTSWGSALGARMALKRPDLFYAYIGHSQIVNATEGLKHAYNEVLGMAKSANDQGSVDKLVSFGSPPYEDARTEGQLMRIIKKYERDHSTPAPTSWWKLASEYDNETDARYREDGDDYSFINYAGYKKLGIRPMEPGINFMKDGLRFKIPVYFIQGEVDILTSKELSKAWFIKLKAPKKEYILVPGAAHGHNKSIIDAQYYIAKKINVL